MVNRQVEKFLIEATMSFLNKLPIYLHLYFNNKDEELNSDGINELWNMRNAIISNNEYYVIKENN